MRRVVPIFVLAVLVGAGDLVAQSSRQSGRSAGGMVSAAQPLATDAGVRMLEMGGNAADAAVAAAFAIAIVEPTMNSIGGRNQIFEPSLPQLFFTNKRMTDLTTRKSCSRVKALLARLRSLRSELDGHVSRTNCAM